VAKHEFWDKECTAVVVYTESFFTQQLAGVTTNLVKCQKKLLDLDKTLGKWRRAKARGRRPTVRGVHKSVRGILSAQFMKELIQTHVEQDRGLPRLRYELDHTALAKLTNQRLGRTVLVTDHPDWHGPGQTHQPTSWTHSARHGPSRLERQRRCRRLSKPHRYEAFAVISMRNSNWKSLCYKHIRVHSCLFVVQLV